MGVPSRVYPPSKCEYHPTARRHDAESRKGKTDKREPIHSYIGINCPFRSQSPRASIHEQTNRPRRVLCRVKEYLQQRASTGIDHFIDVARHEEQDDQEDSAGEGADADAGDHDFGASD